MDTEVPCMSPKFNRSRSRNTSLGLRNIGAKARLKLSQTKETAEPRIIIQSKSILKATKRATLAIKNCAESLYNAQSEKHHLERLLSTQLSNIHIQNQNDDRFGIFCNNMGRVQSNMHEMYQIYLLNLKHQLIAPLHDFNLNEIAKCQQTKLKLKTMKAEHDIINAKELKIREMLDERYPTQQSSSSSPKHKHKGGRHHRSKTAIKLDELQSVRNEFLKSFMFMDAKKLHILQSIKNYMSSLQIYARMHAEDIRSNSELMHDFKILSVPSERFWSKDAMILKEGWFEMQQDVNRKSRVFRKEYFKLFNGKKLIFMDGEHGILKGCVDLNKIFDIGVKGLDLIQIKTMDQDGVNSVVYTFRFESSECRDAWLNALKQTIASKTVSIKQIEKRFRQRGNNQHHQISG